MGESDNTGRVEFTITRSGLAFDVTDAASNTLRYLQAFGGTDRLQVLDKEGNLRCEVPTSSLDGLSEPETVKRLQAAGVPPTLIESMQSAGKAMHDRDLANQASAHPNLASLLDLIKFAVVGEPTQMKPGDIPSVCKPKGNLR